MATWQWANTMFAAITCPGFMSDPWNAFMIATETMSRLFTGIGDNDEIRSWTVGRMPLIPYHAMEERIGDGSLQPA